MKVIAKRDCLVIVTLTLFGVVLMQYDDVEVGENAEEEEIYDPGPMQEYGWNILLKISRK